MKRFFLSLAHLALPSLHGRGFVYASPDDDSSSNGRVASSSWAPGRPESAVALPQLRSSPAVVVDPQTKKKTTSNRRTAYDEEKRRLRSSSAGGKDAPPGKNNADAEPEADSADDEHHHRRESSGQDLDPLNEPAFLASLRLVDEGPLEGRETDDENLERHGVRGGYDYSAARAAAEEADAPSSAAMFAPRELKGKKKELFAAGQYKYSVGKLAGSMTGYFGGTTGAVPKDGKYFDSPTPITLDQFDVDDIKSISAGEEHTVVVLKDGSAWASGYGSDGQLCTGDGARRQSIVQSFVRIPDLSDVDKVVAGPLSTILILEDGSAFACGLNSAGNLGVGPSNSVVYSPTRIELNDFIVDAAASRRHTVFLTSEGNAFGAGKNEYGQLGLGNAGKQYVPTLIRSSVKQVAVGRSHTVFLDNKGDVWTVGRANFGQLGHGNTADLDTPTKVLGLSEIKSVHSAVYSTYVLHKNNTLSSVGDNRRALGLGSSVTDSFLSTFQKVENGDDIKVVACGGESSNACILVKEDDSVLGFGSNFFVGKLGVGDRENKNTPTAVALPEGASEVIAIAPGGYHTLFLTKA